MAMLGFVLAAVGVRAQDLEPRAYVNTPVGLNFLIAGYAYSQGGLSTDPALPIARRSSRILSTLRSCTSPMTSVAVCGAQ